MGFRHRSLDEIVEELEAIRERSFGTMSTFDYVLLDVLIHDIKEKHPAHKPALCSWCDYFDWNMEPQPAPYGEGN